MKTGQERNLADLTSQANKADNCMCYFILYTQLPRPESVNIENLGQKIQFNLNQWPRSLKNYRNIAHFFFFLLGPLFCFFFFQIQVYTIFKYLNYKDIKKIWGGSNWVRKHKYVI